MSFHGDRFYIVGVDGMIRAFPEHKEAVFY
jgi:hypothetical protein